MSYQRVLVEKSHSGKTLIYAWHDARFDAPQPWGKWCAESSVESPGYQLWLKATEEQSPGLRSMIECAVARVAVRKGSEGHLGWLPCETVGYCVCDEVTGRLRSDSRYPKEML